jgi:hypothetical protein
MRNTKNINKIKKLTKKEKYHYRKRLKIKHFLNICLSIVEKSIELYKGIVYFTGITVFINPF